MKVYYIKTPEARLLSNVVKHAVNRIVITMWCLIIGFIPLIITAVKTHKSLYSSFASKLGQALLETSL